MRFVIALCFALVASGAPAQDRGDWFESLKQPESGTSCCDVSDCRATRAEFHTGQWFAEVNGTMTPIPPEKIVKAPLSIDGDSYVCASPHGAIYCFVPPPSSF